MRVEFLGDANDYCKGYWLQHLAKKSLLENLCVDPMTTDKDAWGVGEWTRYCTLLGIDEPSLRHQDVAFDLSSHVAPAGGRVAQYFQDLVADTGDLFLDPDTGLTKRRTGDTTTAAIRSGAEKFVFSGEVEAILDASPSKLIVVYQHGLRYTRGEDRRGLVQTMLGSHCHNPLTRNLAADFGTLILFFMTRDEGRMSRLQAELTRETGATGDFQVVTK